MMANPDYKRIFTDLIMNKFPEKQDVLFMLEREVWTSKNVIDIDRIISGEQLRGELTFNKKLRSYDKESILWFLNFQKKNHYNNTEMANEFAISRNTFSKWKKMFQI